ncbi:MAG: HEPN domain-containing protein [Proteobacteria bacterium]|nr:HEPN domain-containing protein [Pseudomonadota bacterium]MBU2260674.1 HEPN domain-containing protein [Pseudomonadota bacterium]
MTLSWADKKMLSQARMAKAREFLEDAKGNFREGRVKTSINRSYYALLAAVRSILILHGSNPETHEGAVTMLSLKFVKTELLPVETVKTFKLLFSRRADADYGDFDSTDAADAEEAIRLADEAVEEIERLRTALLHKDQPAENAAEDKI